MIGFPDAAWSSLSHRGGCCANDRRCQRHTQTILSCPDAMNSYVYCPSFFSVRSTIAHWVGTCRLSAIFGIGSRSLESIYYYPLS
ncbi:hypothetical protein AFLA_010575 [Aspergillus flavus NRRL3357]|nr:hypothetical protein AFLA_010575 [Aspergillus flavus NRRL3357]